MESEGLKFKPKKEKSVQIAQAPQVESKLEGKVYHENGCAVVYDNGRRVVLDTRDRRMIQQEMLVYAKHPELFSQRYGQAPQTDQLQTQHSPLENTAANDSLSWEIPQDQRTYQLNPAVQRIADFGMSTIKRAVEGILALGDRLFFNSQSYQQSVAVPSSAVSSGSQVSSIEKIMGAQKTEEEKIIAPLHLKTVLSKKSWASTNYIIRENNLYNNINTIIREEKYSNINKVYYQNNY